ncbi:tetratricopeptide repeat protein [Povalibacter sp.]|uniref:tetratricopeptide repeat protein n=1 Tax=Povalibacter sp. TaxID=1962978 RepID=UPI002F4061C7
MRKNQSNRIERIERKEGETRYSFLCALCVVCGYSGVLLLGLAGSATAQSIDYDPRRPDELRACDEDYYRGRDSVARECYTLLINGPYSAVTRAEAAWRNGDLQRANRFFREAVRSNQRLIHARVRWARLYLSTHQYADAQKLLREALELSPNDTYGRLALAQVYADRFEGQARTLLNELLQEDDALFEAHLLAARMALEDGRLDDADKALDRAAKRADSKFPPLELYSARATLDLARGRDSAAMLKNSWVNRALNYNPQYGAVFESLARFEVMRRRYGEATPLLRKAVEVQPSLWSAHADLGANLLRLGDIDAARQHLQLAYEGDPYSPTTVNTLRLLDRVDEIQTSSTQLTLPATAGTPASEVELRLRLHKKEAAALHPYVMEVARDSIVTFSQRYGYRPTRPLTVELYPEHDDFAVRVAALPGIGLLGVTFGDLVVMDSPSGRATGDFHWGTTLWHEMAHVFTLSMTDNRVPRWLSEGVSVFEEWRTGPTPGVVITPDVLVAMREQRLLPVADLDSGFIRPQYPNQVQVSYAQAGLICLFIEQRWGFAQLPALVRQFERETTTRAAVESTLKISAEEFDRGFQAFLQQRYGNVLARFDEWRRSSQSAGKAIMAEQWQEAIEPARAAIAIYPEDIGPASPYPLLARAMDKTGRRDEAIDALLRFRAMGGWDPAALRELSQWLEQANRTSEASEVLAAVNYADPLNAAQHRTLGEQLLAAGRPEESLREFQVLLALDSHDPAMAHFGMARALRTQGDAVASRRHLLEALETAPHYKPAQALLLQMIEERTE